NPGSTVARLDEACLIAEFVGVPVADKHFDVRRHSLCVRSPLRRQRHSLRLRESLWVLVIHLIPLSLSREGITRPKREAEVIPCGEPRAHRWDAPGAQGTRPGTRYMDASPRAT